MAEEQVSFSELPISQRAKWLGFQNELSIAKNYFAGFTTWQVIAIMGIAISGLMTFVNTFDAITKINQKVQTCTQSADIKKAYNDQFITLIVISCLAIVVGIIVAWLLRGSVTPRKVITMGIIFSGVFGILYAVSIKLQNSTMNSVLKAGGSWVIFVGFLIWGYLMGRQKDAKLESAVKSIKFPRNVAQKKQQEIELTTIETAADTGESASGFK